MIKRDIIKLYLADPDFAKMPRKQLARIIYAENKGVWSSIETVRGAIRYEAGAVGKEKRKKVKKGKEEHRTQSYAVEYARNILPKSYAEAKTPYVVDGCRRVLLLSDIHIPYHDLEALDIAIRYGIDHEADTVILNGDTIDFHGVSRYERDPRKRSLSEELDACRDFLDALRVAFPTQRIIWKDGNHDERLRKYLAVKAPELLDLPELRMDIILDLPGRSIDYVTEKRMIQIGNLNVAHGHEFFGVGSVNPARTLYLRTKTSTIAGHNHRSSEHSEKDLNGSITTTWSIGCLCELQPDYMPYNNHNHGFAFVTVDESGWFQVHNKRIYNGQML